MKLESFGLSDVGLRRTHNEDSFHRCDDTGLYLVADGMGGHAAGEVASNNAIEAIVEFSLQHQGNDATWPFDFDPAYNRAINVLITGVRAANQRLYNMQREQPELSGMGTTIAGILIQDSAAVAVHVGDSRVYRWRNEELKQVTSDHSWVNEQLMKKIITPEEARNHRYKNVITRALGNRVDIEVEVGMDDLKPGDIYMICSDGLSGMVEDSVMTEILKTTPGLREAANRLVAAANEAGGHDNITVVLIRAVE